MAASRGALTFRVTSVCCPVRASGRTQARTSSWQLVHEGRAPVCPPPSRRVHSSNQLAPSPLSPPSPPALRPQGAGLALWEDSVSLCVLVPPGEAEGQLTLVHIPVSRDLREVLVLGANSSSELCFPLTTVDGRRPDDISVGVLRRQHSCFRSLFEGESCPAPFTHGSRFFCFHCRRPAPSPGGQDRRPDAAPCAPETVQRRHAGEDGGGEEKLALMYERLRVEEPGGASAGVVDWSWTQTSRSITVLLSPRDEVGGRLRCWFHGVKGQEVLHLARPPSDEQRHGDAGPSSSRTRTCWPLTTFRLVRRLRGTQEPAWTISCPVSWNMTVRS